LGRALSLEETKLEKQLLLDFEKIQEHIGKEMSDIEKLGYS
jgi:hypothetical protein